MRFRGHLLAFLRRRLRPRNLFLLAFVGIPLFTIKVQSATLATWTWRLARPTSQFVPFAGDARVHFEPGSEIMARAVADALPGAIRIVEQTLGRPFLGPITVYVCASEATFEDYTGRRASAGVINKRIFVSSKQADHLERIASLVAHELVHYHVQERQWLVTRLYRSATQSPLISEGLAVYGSNGGGADKVTEHAAWLALAAGKHWRNGDLASVDSDMLYKQAGLFIGFLATTDAGKFRRFLTGFEDGDSSDSALMSAYGENLDQLWARFLAEAAKHANP